MAQASTRPNDSEPFSLFQVRIDHSLKWLEFVPCQGGSNADLVRSDTCTKSRANYSGVDVLWQRRQVFGVQDAVLLKASIFVVKMVCCITAVLFSP